MDTIHRSRMGTHHPAPDAEVAWTVHDTRGYLDGGSPCDDCGACDCETNRDGQPLCALGEGEVECIGLSFSYVCLDGGDNLCEECFEEGDDTPEVVECDCP